MSERPYTVGELIAALREFPADSPVIVYTMDDYRRPAPTVGEFNIDHPTAPLSATVHAVIL